MSIDQSARSEQSVDVHQLQNQIESIDSMCQVKLGQIYALCTAMLRAMEAPEFWRHPDTSQDLITLIQHTADDLRAYVNGAAEEVGCNCVDDVERGRERRIAVAHSQANGTGVSRA
ncbi:hypothetical protein WT12_14600 [Burkholderia territorii]|uniref:hypothetical protein n=1 Tax=Burkholderia territorii TaxID=1503055 RepID=UPI0007568A71|nr:hypothetical protein [Burkholderia territorii]KVN46812.1 hypothetical protein WT12_14600 [Burkholderia territorii]